ncbi:uncharacterized protein [Epargyreus clarus]|uniref:uncharacterized protein n=1 Tax=Epargyreus clarus TaxID=520877 RepID=UPI003C2CEB1F
MFATSTNLVCCVIFLSSAILASHIDDLKKEYLGYIMDCAKEYPISGSEIELLKNKQVPESKNAKCLLACSYKKGGMMDDQGNLSVEGLNTISKKYLADDPEQVKRAEEFANACKSVNDESVSDGAQGCDRAALIFKCSVEKAPEIAAKTDAEVKAEFTKVIMTCVKDHPVDMADLIKLQNLKMPTKSESKCLLACSYRKIGTLSEKGTFDLEKMYKLAEESKEGDEKAIANGKKLADICLKVNDETVSDGEKGCERSALMFGCVIENAPKLGFTL